MHSVTYVAFMSCLISAVVMLVTILTDENRKGTLFGPANGALSKGVSMLIGMGACLGVVWSYALVPNASEGTGWCLGIAASLACFLLFSTDWKGEESEEKETDGESAKDTVGADENPEKDDDISDGVYAIKGTDITVEIRKKKE